MIFSLIKKAILWVFNMLRIFRFLDGKVVVFDFDGTMTAFRYAAFAERLLPCLDSEVYEHSKHNNLYAGAYVPHKSSELEKVTPNGEHAARMLGCMQWLIEQLGPERVFVLTRTELTLIAKKNEAILSNFNVRPDHIFHVQDANDKEKVLDAIMQRFQEDIWFVEDSFKTQLNAEEHSATKQFRVHGINISEFLV